MKNKRANEEMTEEAIQRALRCTVWAKDDNTSQAFIEGARYLLDFLKHNPELINDYGASQFRHECLFPSVINLSK